MSARIWDWFVTPAGTLPPPVKVLDGSIEVSATRNPQVQARLSVPFVNWSHAKQFDPFTRAKVYLELRYTNVAAGPLSEFGQGKPVGTLAALDWSDKASNPQTLGGPTTAIGNRVRRVTMYVTDAFVNELEQTLDVTLASADCLLYEVVNFGQDWMPRPGSAAGGVFQWALDDVWGEFFRTFRLPLWMDATLADPTTGYAWRSTMDPWETGANAWSWLDSIRTEVPGWRYVLNTQTGQVSFLQNFGDQFLGASVRAGATRVTSRRSVETAAEGMNQYADGVAIHWTDRTDQGRREQWEFASSNDDWRAGRRAFVEERDMPASGGTSMPALAQARLTRMQKFRRLTTVTKPIDSTSAPFRDLFDHPYRTSVQSITYSLSGGDVTTTYLESDV